MGRTGCTHGSKSIDIEEGGHMVAKDGSMAENYGSNRVDTWQQEYRCRR